MTLEEAIKEIHRLEDGILLAKRIIYNHDCIPGCDGAAEAVLERLEKLCDTVGLPHPRVVVKQDCGCLNGCKAPDCVRL